MTGLDDEQLTDLVARIHGLCGDKFVSAGRPLALGLFRSVALVVCLIRTNVTQDFAGAVFGVSQATVSRRWDLLRPVIGNVLAEVVPDPRQVVGRGTVLVDGTVCPTWDWAHVPDLFSAKTGYPGTPGRWRSVSFPTARRCRSCAPTRCGGGADPSRQSGGLRNVRSRGASSNRWCEHPEHEPGITRSGGPAPFMASAIVPVGHRSCAIVADGGRYCLVSGDQTGNLDHDIR